MAHTYTIHWPQMNWKSRKMSDKAIGWIALAVTTISGATFYAYAKVLAVALSPLSLLFVSELLTAFFIIMSYGFLPVFMSCFRLHKRDWLPAIVVGCLNGIAGPLLLFAGLGYTTAVNAGFYSNMQMVFIVILAVLMLGEKMTTARLSAVCTIIAGAIVISLRGFTDGIDLQTGDLLIIASALCYALASIVYRKYLSHVEPHVALLARSMVAIGAFFIVSPFLQHPFITEVTHFPVVLIPALIGFGFIGRFLNSVTYYEAIEKIELTTVSLVGSLSIVFTSIFAFLYLGEPIEWFHYIGGAFIVLGTMLLELVGAHPNKEHLEMHLKQRVP